MSESGLGYLRGCSSTSVGPGNHGVDRELLRVVAGGAQRDHAQDFVLGVEAQLSVQEAARVQSGLLSGARATLVRRVGSSCL